MEARRVLDPRSSFAAKVAVALLGTVGLLLAVMLLVVQAETRGQVEQVTDQAIEQARRAFEESEERRREQLAQRAEVFVGSRRTMALLEGAIEAGDIPRDLVGELIYNLDLAGFEDTTTLAVLTDPNAEPVITLLGLAPTDAVDPSAIAPLTRALLDRYATDLTGYRLVNGELYTVRSEALVLSGRLIGTAAFGLPIRDEDAEALGRVVGAEVCFVAGGQCVAGTPTARAELAPRLAGIAEAGGRTMATHDDARWEFVADPLTAEGPTEGRLAMAVPLEPELAPFDRIRRSLAIGSAGALALALFLAVLISRGLTRPVRTLVEATRKVGRGEYDTRVPADARDEIGQLAESFNAMTEGLALKEQYRGVLDKVVSRDVAEELLRGEVRLGGENREVTVLFADIRGFTELTEGMAPQEVIGLLNETMERLSTAVEECGGVVDKYVGDEVMAVFGAPLAQPDHAVRAARAAVAMQVAMDEVNEARRRRDERPVRIGVGVHCGEVVAGNMGSTNRLNYTVLGESVNLAARLCAVAGPGEILVSDPIRERLPGDATVHPAGERDLKGFSRPVPVFRVSGVPEPGAGDRVAGVAGRDGGGPGDGSDAGGSGAGSGPGRRNPGAGRIALMAAIAAAGAVLGPGPAAVAQSAPTLSELGLEWISPGGTVQLGLSGRLDLEGYLPTGDEEPWIIPTSDPFFAGRARLFGDAFIGSKLFLSTELRVDRGEEPRPGPWDARIDQAFLRVGPFTGAFVQLGKFVSPFGGWPQRHHTARDPFIRPPAMYDYRTMICAGIAPATTGGFVEWKDEIGAGGAPFDFRPIGAPPIWGAPYQWGAMLTGAMGEVTYRVAAMNSAPSSEPEAWEWNADGARHPSLVANVGVRLSPALRVSASYNRGPYLDPAIEGTANFPASWSYASYVQELFAVEAVYAVGPWTVRGEGVADRWEVPNVPENVWDFSYYVEAQRDIAAGAYVAARFGQILFNELGGGDGYVSGGDDDRWDYPFTRLQLAGGYRLLRNVGVQAEYMLNHTADPAGDPADDLVSVQLWWQY
jgi:class 3 adenylate cyclase